MLLAAATVDMAHVPYKGPAPAMQDLIGGQVDCGFLAEPTVLPQITSGRLVALASSATQRSPLLSQVPTVAESGYPGFGGSFWLVMLAPRNVPADMRQRFVAALDAAIRAPGHRERAAGIGIEMAGTAPAVAQERKAALSNAWKTVDRRVGLQVD